jgi:sedoheptulose-bisphosphatase
LTSGATSISFPCSSHAYLLGVPPHAEYKYLLGVLPCRALRVRRPSGVPFSSFARCFATPTSNQILFPLTLNGNGCIVKKKEIQRKGDDADIMSQREMLAAFLTMGIKDDDAVEVGLVLKAIAAASSETSAALRTEVIQRAKGKGKNKFGDDVLSVDLLADDCISRHLQQCPQVAAFCSEERPTLTRTGNLRQGGGAGYCVAFDPLDGSSVIPCNFAVGSIFGVWRGDDFVGQRVKDIVASVVVVYGPRTAMFLSHRNFGGVVEFLLERDGSWVRISETPLVVRKDATIFAPGNLRAVAVLPWYRRIVVDYMNKGTTLRYTGGMVPDVCQILIKGNGVFMTPESPKHKVKLRVLFECGPMAFMLQCAGGYSTTGLGDYMDVIITELHQRSPIALGSSNDVRRFEDACSNQQRTQGKL